MCIFLNIQNHDFVVFGKIREKWAHFSALAMLSSLQGVGTSSEPTAERIGRASPQKNN